MPVVPFRVFGIAARPRTLPPEVVLFWNWPLVQSMTPAGVSPLLLLRPRFAVSPYPGCAVFLSRATADYSYVIGRVLSSNLTFPLECYPAIPTPPPQRPGPLMGFRSLQHLRNPRSTHRGQSHPLRSVFRVWLPS
jgi:hypothetical protein